MMKSDGTKHYSVVTRTERDGKLWDNTCFATPTIAEKYAERQAVKIATGRMGYVDEITNPRDVRVKFAKSEAEWSVKVVACYSNGCSLFRQLPKSHR